MRIVRILGWTAGGVVATLTVAFAALQLAPVQRAVASLVSDLASSPDSKLSLQGLSGFVPTDLKVARIELADRQGPWLTIEDAELRWSFLSLLGGRLRIDTVAARRVDVARAPESTKAEPAPAADKSGALRLPVGVDLQSLSVEELHLGAALAQVDSRWKLAGNALLPADLAEGRLKLDGNRVDGPTGRLGVDLRFDANRQTVDGSMTFDEGKGGIAAALLQRPDLDGVATRLTVKGDARAGNADLSVSAADAVTASGKATWQPRDKATEVELRLDAAGPGLPKGPLTDALRGPLTLTATASVDEKVVALREARLALGPLAVVATGRYDRAADRLQATTTVEAAEPGPFAPLLAGASWRGLRLETKADIADLAKTPRGTVLLNGGAEDISIAAIDSRLPPPGKVVIDGRAALRDGTLTLETLNVTSAPVSVTAAGSYVPATDRAQAKVTLNLPSLAPYSALAGRDLVGNAALDLSATSDKGDLALTWQGTLRDLGVPNVPRDLASSVSLGGSASLKRDETWALRGVRVASEGGAFGIEGSGRGKTGTFDLSLDLPKLAALGADVAGTASAKATIALSGENTEVKLTAALRDIVHQQLKAQKLDLSATASLDAAGAVSGTVEASGDVASQALTLNGRFARNASGGLTVPSFKGSWASAVLDIVDLAVTEARTSGHARIGMARLQDLAPLIGTEIAGSFEAEVKADPASPAGRLDIRVQGADIRSGGIGVGALTLGGTIDEPMGDARADLTLTANRLAGVSGVNGLTATAKGGKPGLDVTLQANGSTAANLAARLEMVGEEILVALQRFDGRYDRIPLTLAAPTRIRVTGEQIRIDPTNLRLGGGRLTAGGTLDPTASDFQVELAALPLSLVEAFAPGTNLEGTLNTRVRVQGAMAAPRIEATYNAAGVRARLPDTALVPPIALQGTASLAGQQAAFDARVTAGGSTNLTLKGQATLPQGRAALAGNATIGGTVDIAPFAPLAGNSIRGLSGTLRPNLTFEIAGSRVTGSGTVDLSNAALAMPEAGLRLGNGEARLALQGDTVQIQRFTFQTGRSGAVTASGTVRLDPDQGPAFDLTVGSQRALLVNRPDLVATVSSNIKIAGSTSSGIDVSGPITIDRAEISVGAAQSIDFPTLQVREINKPGAPPPAPVKIGAAKPDGAKKAEPPPGAMPIRLALAISAPQAIFVRGRGLDAEMSGQFQVGGTAAAPTVIGGLNMRRGDFTLGGRKLNFTRGLVALDNLNTIDPSLDFVASTVVQQTTITITISGTSRAPVIAISSSPSLPADEAMALLIFGKPASSLSAFELVQIAGALAELTGQSPGSSFMGRIRQGLGLDRLTVGTDSGSGSGGSSVSLEAGRYVAPGIYVGAKQGASGNSSRGVVQIEVLDNVKLEGDIGADSTGRVGAKMEWDY